MGSPRFAPSALIVLMAVAACAQQSVRSPVTAPASSTYLASSTNAPSPSASTNSDAKPPPLPPVAPRVARLARLARVWGDVQYMHPYLWEDRAIDWDAALAVAIPQINSAKTDDDEAAAVQSMLDALHDPLTRVEPSESPPSSAPRVQTSTKWATPDVLILKLALHEWGEMRNLATELKKQIEKAKSLVIDLRAADDSDAWRANAGLDEIADSIAAHDCVAPTERSVLHSGYRPQRGDSSGGYRTVSVSTAPHAYTASKRAHPSRVVVLVNEHSVVPDLALAMQHANDAKIVAQGRMTDPASLWRQSIVLAGGKRALFRTTEIETGVGPDVVLPDAAEIEGGAALDAAVKLAKQGWRAGGAVGPASAPRPVRWRPDTKYDEPYPSLEHRFLALFRFWNVIRLFYPYMHLLERGAWDRALTDFIPHFEQAKDMREYVLAVAELAARVPDSHVRLSSKEFWSGVIGYPLTGVTIRHIDGVPVVTKAGNAETSAGLRIGDEVMSIDGESYEARVARVRPYIAASNSWTLARDADNYAPSGAKDSETVLRVRGADNKERDVRAKRTAWSPPPPSPSPHYKTFDDGGVGYVDMSTLTTVEVDAMFVALAATRAIVFDMRGERGPKGTAWPITPHLNVRGTTGGPQFFRALVGSNAASETESRLMFIQPLPNDDKPKYTGKTVMLIDQETQSQAEGTGLFFEAANGTKFIGTPSAGANGDVTSTCLPGEICVSFSGHDVRHADGRQLQCVGLQPDVEVRPTIQGLRAGRDEVLERALRYLRDGH